MVFINKLADHSHHDDLRVDDELVVQKLKLPANATVEGLTVSHISGLSDSLGNLTIDESALLADVNTQIAGKADASSVYTQTELDTIHATFAPASTTYTKTQVDNGLTAKLDATTYDTGIALKADITALNATNTTLATKADASATTASLALKADLSTVNTSLDTKLDTSIFNTQIATKADLSSLQATNTTLTQKANQTDVDTALSAKADLSALNTTNTTLTEKLNISDANTALALKVDTTDFNTLTATVNTKAPQASLDTTNTNLGTLTSTVSSLTTQVNSQAAQDAPFAQIPQVYTDLGLNANGNGESFYHNGHRLAAQSFLVGKDKFQETQPEDSYFRYTGYIDLLNDYTPGYYDFNDPHGEIRFRNNCKIRMKDNSVETLVPFTQTSDGRAKTNKEEIKSGLDAVLRLKPQTYEKNGKTESGFITQEVLEIPELKHLVNVPENESEHQSLNYIGIIAHLVSAIQELNNKLKRIIKRPTLFATSRRNFGNLLTHYETGQDGTTPDPDPTPDPVAFTTSWSINGGIVEANLTGISSHRTTEVIVLTRDDGTVLATLDENKVGDWDLQHDEGTTYGSYTYNVRLYGVIKSTFTRDYQPNVPSFTTNFFSNTAKRISCGVENISNPHDSYSVRLARPDDTILDTQVLNDASAFFLQFTESDYGTYDYKLLLSKWTTTSTSNPNIPPGSYWVDTVIATHQQIFVRPEPTFTTGWTKSGLTINADLSSITGAHPDFYAYLCRDGGATLATHHFQTGQTTTSLSFTETNYGTYTYQLKLGTTEVSTHTETYVRPTPTYTASFSTNELTLTAGITSITNAHNSFAITLERDGGTVLQTHTLADGETSFTFTQTETSYATFNYIVKLNGAQTDTYSATYTPPPTPTFDIALTNDDLAITATLTNIVNPDPYYTLMIHDATDAHLDGHTFATTDTTVVLTWTETSYGEKTYTKLLNGASIGTETITLTDPNTSFTFPEVGTFIYFDETTWGTNFRLQLQYTNVNGYDQWTYYRHSPTNTYSKNGIQVERSTGIWTDWGNEAPNTVNNDTPTSGKIQFENQYNQVYTFTNPYPTSTPTPTQPTLVNTISITGGAWNTATYDYVNTNVNNTYYEYGLSIAGEQVKENYYIAYNWTTRKWFDTQPTNHHNTFGTSSTDLNTTNRETTENPAVVYVFDTSPRFTAQFTNPYYEQPVAVLMEDLRNATPVSSPSNKSFTYKSGSGTIADPWIYGEAYYSTGALVNSTDTAKTIKWPASDYTGEGSGWADNDTTSYPEVSNTGSTINITRFSNPHFSFTDPYYNHLPPA
ncbi:unnamed protein product [Bathycoccus prasinos]